MAITFFTMYYKNKFFTIQMGTKKNLNILIAKNKYKKTLLTYNKNLRKNYHELILYNL